MRSEDKSVSPPKGRRGVTLAETLMVVGIVLLIAGITFSVIAGSRERAKTSSELSSLHQLALAGAMYHDDGGEWPLSVVPLIQAKLVPREIVSSSLDVEPRGLANALAVSIDSKCPACGVSPTPYRRTFMGPLDFGHLEDVFRRDIEPTTGAGWLVSLTQSSPSRADQPEDKFNNPTGTYFRVLLTGSVVSRIHRRVVYQGNTVYAVPFMFADGDDAWRQRIASGR